MNNLYPFIDKNSLEDFALAILVALGCMLIAILTQRIVLRHLNVITQSTHTLIDDFLVEILTSTKPLILVGACLYVGTHFLTLSAGIEKLVGRAVVGLLILQAGFWAHRALNFWLQRRFATDNPTEMGSRAMTRGMISFVVRIALWVLVTLMLLDNMGLNVTALVTSLGIGGIAVALAVQNILGDLFASLSISIDQPFVIGDFIIVDELMGTVEHVGLKTTRIRSLGGEQIIFSNNDLLKSRIRNYKRMQERRAVFAIGVTYDTPPEQLEAIPKLIRAAIEEQNKVRFDRAHFKSFGASSLDFEVAYYLLNPDFNLYMDIQQAINLNLTRSFKERGIQFAFPTQTLHIAREPLHRHKTALDVARCGPHGA